MGFIPVADARIHYDQAAAKYANALSWSVSNSSGLERQADRPDKYSFLPDSDAGRSRVALVNSKREERDARSSTFSGRPAP